MYVPPIFAAKDLAALHAFIEAYSFATVVSSGPDGMVASHVPVLLDRERGPHGTLVAHLARANPHGRALGGSDVLAIFHGPHGYISPSWYETHPSVPTWNYAAVHAYGRAEMIDDPARLEDIVQRLTVQYEAGRERPWTTADLSREYVAGMLRGIVGFEVEITRLEGKHKLSQNRNATDRRNVIAALAASASADDQALAEYMARHAAPKAAE
jgi:transcriptional regulator